MAGPKKPLRISDDINDLNPQEFADGDTIDADGIVNPNGDLTFEDSSNSEVTLTEILNQTQGGYAVKFGSNSTANAGKWLEIHRNIVSNESPFIVTDTSKLRAISVGAKNSTTMTVGIYKNGIQIDTVVLTAQTKNNKIGLTHSLVALDEISAKIESGSGTDVLVHVVIG